MGIKNQLLSRVAEVLVSQASQNKTKQKKIEIYNIKKKKKKKTLQNNVTNDWTSNQ